MPYSETSANNVISYLSLTSVALRFTAFHAEYSTSFALSTSCCVRWKPMSRTLP